EIFDVRDYFEELRQVAANLPHDTINQVGDVLLKAYEAGRVVYLFGNGGSASLASHFACDLGKGTSYCNGGKRFRVIALTDNIPTMTAWANDSSYEDVFSEQLRNFVQPQDVAVAISSAATPRTY